MPRAAEARAPWADVEEDDQAVDGRAWWADLEDVRDRIERRRARERDAGSSHGAAAPPGARGVREIRPGRRLMLVETAAPAPRDRSRRPRPRLTHRVGPRPDMVAAWAVALGFVLLLAAIFSAHG